MNSDTQWTPITSGTMTGTSVVTGTPCHLFGHTRVSFQAIWTGTPNGTFTFQISNYPGTIFNSDGSVISSVTWTTLTNPAGFAALQPAGAAGNAEFGFADMSAKWIRPIYTNASSTGTITFVYASARH